MNTHEEYGFYESDDPRTWDPAGLIPDCLAGAYSVHSSEVDKFWDAFQKLVDACGKVSYFWRMARSMSEESHNRAKTVAATYKRDLAYYRGQKQIWVFEARRCLAMWQLCSYELGTEFHLNDGGRDFLNAMLDSDRRDCARDTIKYARSKGLLLSPDEIEARYVKRLNRRKNKRAETSEGPSS